MRMKSYAQHERYVEIRKKMELLGIKEVSTNRQKDNGTIVWRLPIKYGTDRFIEVASFATGYVRNQNGGYTNYQLNKRCESEPQYYKLSNGDFREYTTRTCRLIPNEIDRLEYLIGYCLKNYYIKRANEVTDGKYVSRWEHEYKLERANSEYGNNKGAMNRIGVMKETQSELEDRIYELESQVDIADDKLVNSKDYTTDLKAQLGNALEERDDLTHDLQEQSRKLSQFKANAISPTKHERVLARLSMLEGDVVPEWKYTDAANQARHLDGILASIQKIVNDI